MSKENYPPFSVLMSVYKNERPEYLDASLKSIENQTVLPSEIVIVEDGPISVELKEIIKKHKQGFNNVFKVIISKKNQGLGASLKLGTRYISNNWIARMDTDDISVSNRFEIELNKIKKDPNLAVVGGQVKEFEGQVNNTVGFRRVPEKEETIRDFMKWRSPFNHPTVFLNKKVLEKVGGYNPFGNIEDYYLWVRIIAKGYHVCNLSDVLVNMRVDQGLYKRRGNVKNIRYFFKLRRFLFEKGLISMRERITGNLLILLNIIIPGWIRKIIYQNVIHSK